MSQNSICENGIVKKVKGEICYVEINRTAKCEGCKACAFGRKKKIAVPALNNLNAKKNDKVILEGMSSLKESTSYLLMFVMPISLMLIFLTLATFLLKNEIYSLISALLGLGLGFVLVFIADKIVVKNKIKKGEIAVIKKIIE